LNWAIKDDDGNYQIVGHYMHRAGWAEDPEQVTNFPPSATVDDVIDRMIAIVQEAAGSST
jgi:hypothetical protein